MLATDGGGVPIESEEPALRCLIGNALALTHPHLARHGVDDSAAASRNEDGQGVADPVHLAGAGDVNRCLPPIVWDGEALGVSHDPSPVQIGLSGEECFP